MTEKRQRPKSLEGSSRNGEARVSVGSSMTVDIGILRNYIKSVIEKNDKLTN